MNILVLEDDFLQQTRMEQVITKLIDKHHIDVKTCEVFGKPSQLMDAIEEKGGHQLFFLDIEIKTEELKGFQVAKQIRMIDPYAIIVFVTTHSEFMPLSFRYQVLALEFIDKELPESEFEERIERVLLYANEKDSKSAAQDAFYYKSKFAQVQYPFDEIYYIETSLRPHKVVLYTKNDRMEFTASLSQIMKQEKRLIQVHRSFVINPANVVKVDRHNRLVYFTNGTSCLIARNKLDHVMLSIERLH